MARFLLFGLSVEHFTLPIRNSEEERNNQGRDQLEVIRIQSKLQHDLEHKIINHGANGNGEQLESEVREQLTENDLADDNGGQMTIAPRPMLTSAAP